MNLTFDVKFWAIRVVKNRKKKYGVRWLVAGAEQSEYFEFKTPADNRRSELMAKFRKGEPFDVETGLPESEARALDIKSVVQVLQKFAAYKWPSYAAKTRASMIDALQDIAAAMVKVTAKKLGRNELRRIARDHFLLPGASEKEVSGGDRVAVDWLTSNSLPMTAFNDVTVVRDLLEFLAVKQDGKLASVTVYRRKRAVLFNFLEYSLIGEGVRENLLHRIKRTTKPVVEEVDPDVVPNPAQVDRLLVGVTYVGKRNPERGAHLHGLFATMYFSAARPSEVVALRKQDCWLPQKGWGKLTLREARPEAGKKFTDSGEVHDEKGLKHRADGVKRKVPIPPRLVAIIRDHIQRFGVAPDGRLFRSPNGGVVSSGTIWRVWQEARTFAFTPEQAESELASRPYDLRHAAVSLWLNGGVPATEVAARAGHSVDVLLRVYAKCIDGDEEKVNKLIEDLYDHMSTVDNGRRTAPVPRTLATGDDERQTVATTRTGSDPRLRRSDPVFSG